MYSVVPPPVHFAIIGNYYVNMYVCIHVSMEVTSFLVAICGIETNEDSLWTTQLLGKIADI